MVSSHRVSVVAPVVAAAAVLATACGGGGGAQARQAGDRVAPAGTGYTSDQLRQALPVELEGYKRVGEPDAGEYGALKGIQNFRQLQSQVTYDKPECAKVTGSATALDTALRTSPAAVSVFTRGTGRSLSVSLIAVPNPVAEQHVRLRVPERCRTFRIKINGRWSQHEVVEAAQSGIGLGSRVIGVATTVDESTVKTWYVVLRGRGYMATVVLYGAAATRAEAERFARQTYDHAERILP
jgi:hypothetical protein